MKTLRCLFAFITYSFCLSAQVNDSINLGKKITIYSKELGENRKIWVYTPPVTSKNTDQNKHYPVIYLLDGEAHFFSTTGIIQQLSQANGNSVLPEMIVVGIENTNRLRDLTPARPPIMTMDQANPFLRFLSAELIPFIDSNFQASPYRLLAGHSLGGLTAVDILTNFPHLFNAYIVIDPSMWFQNETYLNHALNSLSEKKLKGTRLFIGTANTLPKGMKPGKLKDDKSPETQHIRSIFKLDQMLKTTKNGLKYSYMFYNKEKHNTVPLISLYDGLKFIFDYYAFDVSEKEFSDSSDVLAVKLKKHYKTVSGEMGYQQAAPQSFINYVGYDALGKQQYRKAEAFFQLNIEWYPGSYKVYEAYADLLAVKKDTVNSIAYYKKAISVQSDPLTIRKLNGLTKQESLNLTEDALRKYLGVYTLMPYKIDITLLLKDGKLRASVPGQPEDEFVPVSKDVFTVKGKQGYTITFKMNGNKPIEFTSEQPNGTFKAVYKHE